MADSTLSLGRLTARAFWITRRSAGLLSGLGPPALTAIVISLPMRAKAFDMRSQRAIMVALRVSKMRPMGRGVLPGRARRTSRGVCCPAMFYDPYSRAMQEDPFPAYRHFLEKEPCAYNPKMDFYALFRFDDVWPATLD